MEARTRSAAHAALLAVMLFAATASLAGCSVFANRQPAIVTTTLQSVQDDFTWAGLQIEVTQDALEELSSSTDADLKQAYYTFTKVAQDVQETGKRLIIHADEMHFQGPSYLVESEKSTKACVFPSLRKPGDLRTEEMGTYFDAIEEQAWEVKRAYRAFQFDLSQIQSYLSTNLTAKSVDTITPILSKAKVDADSLNYSLARALQAINTAKAAKSEKFDKPG